MSYCAKGTRADGTGGLESGVAPPWLENSWVWQRCHLGLRGLKEGAHCGSLGSEGIILGLRKEVQARAQDKDGSISRVAKQQ